MSPPEPIHVYPEKEFQTAVVTLLNNMLVASGQQFILLEDFGLDIAVFLTAESGVLARFIEVKAFSAQRIGGVGFGNNRGRGAQVDLLMSDDVCLPMLNGMIRWIYADSTRPRGSQRYALFTCENAKAVTMGGVVRGKQNNLRVSALRDSLVDWAQLNSQLYQFLFTVENKSNNV